MADSYILEAAREQVRRAGQGYVESARYAVNMAVIAIRDLSAVGALDQERMIYLDYLRSSLEKILEGKDAAKALGLRPETGRPKVDYFLRDLLLFNRVALALVKRQRALSTKSLPSIFRQVAKDVNGHPGWGRVTARIVRTGWENMGGLSAFEAIKRDGHVTTKGGVFLGIRLT